MPQLDVMIMGKGQTTPLHVGAQKGSAKWLNALLTERKQDLNINCKDENGQTPLHLAKNSGNTFWTTLD